MSETFSPNTTARQGDGTTTLTLVLRWLWVAVPLAWGTLETVRTSLAFFQ